MGTTFCLEGLKGRHHSKDVGVACEHNITFILGK
jgi:hypothetical protein